MLQKKYRVRVSKIANKNKCLGRNLHDVEMWRTELKFERMEMGGTKRDRFAHS